MTIAQDLKALNKNIQALGKTLDSLIKAVEKDEKLKAKPATKILAKKAPAKKALAKKVPAKKKADQPTATDNILKIIKESKQGVDAPTLVKKTGFNQKKVFAETKAPVKAGIFRNSGFMTFTLHLPG